MDFSERTNLLIDSEKLRDKCVAVFGIGGVGSFVAESLVRAGVGHLIVVDNDTVSESNINRQLLALHSTVGRKKISVAIERYRDINPELDIWGYDEFILKENADEIFNFFMVKPDYVCDCIDTVTGKIAIIEECKKRDIPVISCMGTGNKLHPEMFKIADINDTKVCPLCRVMRRELKNRGITGVKVVYSEEEPIKNASTVGSVSYVPSVAGLLITSEVVQQLQA